MIPPLSLKQAFIPYKLFFTLRHNAAHADINDLVDRVGAVSADPLHSDGGDPAEIVVNDISLFLLRDSEPVQRRENAVEYPLKCVLCAEHLLM